ncbi:hypothetical protein H920_08298 [Fukomys damarensis]|uniref:Uncharacterized protein n=1 Tax=Fukomys damarensis TaxID=885580 RepID=A0A091DGT9_FUKDA|nr:hypothetical protein H920_08298 [Fukomys damarensis]
MLGTRRAALEPQGQAGLWGGGDGSVRALRKKLSPKEPGVNVEIAGPLRAPGASLAVSIAGLGATFKAAVRCDCKARLALLTSLAQLRHSCPWGHSGAPSQIHRWSWGGHRKPVTVVQGGSGEQDGAEAGE